MSERPKSTQKADREGRLSAALRENLKRRKAQARGRQADEGTAESAESHDSAGIPQHKGSAESR
jgi:hypothetical protein